MKLSIIICTYNPARQVFSRCLQSVDALQKATVFTTEVILVDNNSGTAISNLDYVAAFLAGGSGRRVVQENRPGLTNARLAGLSASHGDTIVFIDDDNLPAADYLHCADALLEQLPQVAVWGPGTVIVEWEKGSPGWAASFCNIFQARSSRHTQYGCVVGWPEYYPAGTGMVVRREVLEQYAREVGQGALTASDRVGGQLASGGDSQIVWTAVKMGRCAGTSQDLKIKHYISAKKAKTKYMSRLVFSVMSDGKRVFVESFPGEAVCLRQQLPSRGRLVARLVLILTKNMLLLRFRYGVIEMASYVGEQHGVYTSVGAAIPAELRLLTRVFR